MLLNPQKLLQSLGRESCPVVVNCQQCDNYYVDDALWALLQHQDVETECPDCGQRIELLAVAENRAWYEQHTVAVSLRESVVVVVHGAA